LKKLLPLLLLFLSLQSAKASHVAGCEITYAYLGNQKYVIYIDIIRDCRGAAITNTTFTYYHRFQNSSGGSQQYIPTTKPKLITISEVSNICKGGIPFCSKINTSGQGFGIEKHRYTDTIDLTNSTITGHINAGRCIFTPYIVVNQGRPNQSTTESIYNAELSLCRLSSPKMAYNNSGDYISNPINKIQCNVGNFMSYAVNDPDQDSISYVWVKAKSTGYGVFINYTTPFSYDYPIDVFCQPSTTIKCTPKPEEFFPKGIYLNAWTGEVIATPTNCSGLYPMVVEARQYRKDSLNIYRYMGCTRRDLDVWTLDFTKSGTYTAAYNFPPMVSGKKAYKTCANRTVSFNFTIKDSTWNGYQTNPDTLEIKWLNIPKGATLTETKKAVNHYEYSFSWTPTPKDARGHIYPIHVQVKDNRCAAPSITERDFSIFVDGGCCDTFNLKTIKQSGTGFYKIGENLTIATDTLNGYSKVKFQWQAKSPQIDYGNIQDSKPYSKTNTSKLNIDSVQFFHENMSFRLLAANDICADSSNETTLKLADTCFYTQIDSINVYDTLVHHSFDTTFITQWDTGKITVFDTVFTRFFDTLRITHFDTLKITHYDTLRITIYDTNFISVEDTLNFSIPLSGSSPLVVSNFEVYPNPTSDKLIIKIGKFMDFLNYRIEILDELGKIRESTTINNPVIEFNVLDWGVSSGIYYLRIKDPKNKVVEVKKIAIQIK
jgi:hypothetical protein